MALNSEPAVIAGTSQGSGIVYRRLHPGLEFPQMPGKKAFIRGAGVKRRAIKSLQARLEGKAGAEAHLNMRAACQKGVFDKLPDGEYLPCRVPCLKFSICPVAVSPLAKTRMLTKSTDCRSDAKACKQRKQTCRQGILHGRK